MTEDQDERIVAAIEKIADAYDFMAGSLEAIATTIAQHHAKTFPSRRTPAEATISRVPTDEDKLKETQGATGETLKDWTTLDEEEEIGPREKAWLEKHPEGSQKS